MKTTVAFVLLRCSVWVLLLRCALSQQVGAAVVWVEQADYRSVESGAWFEGVTDGSVYLEDFIAGPNLTRTFVTPYISSPAGRKGNSSGYHSVDGDDGIIDGFGRFGGSYELGATFAPDGGVVSFRFDFSYDESGDLPRSVGLVVTNAVLNRFNPSGNRSVAAAFDRSGARFSEWVIEDIPLSIVQSSLEWRPYHTDGAHFIGVVSDVGIGSFTISGVHDVDHVQYSFERIPEPQVWMLGVLAAGWCWGVNRRREAWSSGSGSGLMRRTLSQSDVVFGIILLDLEN